MKEQEPPQPVEPIPIDTARRRRPGRRGARWDMAGIAQQLHTEALAIEDERFGTGSRFLVGMTTTPVTALEVYPLASAARVFARNLVIELSGIAPPAPAKEELPLDHESVIVVNGREGNDLRVGLTPQGEVSLCVAPHLALEVPSVPPVQERSDEPTTSPETAVEEPPAERGEDERVTITGRVGAELQFHTTPRGVLVARFPLAERQEEDATVWHRVVVFGSRGEKLRDTIKKGQLVQVFGYVHEREAPGRDGQARLITEVYAAAVRDPKGSSR